MSTPMERLQMLVAALPAGYKFYSALTGNGRKKRVKKTKPIKLTGGARKRKSRKTKKL